MDTTAGLILVVAAVALSIGGWAAKRRQAARSLPRLGADELALAQRAAEGDERAAQELSRRAEVESLALRRRAETDRGAALQYRDELVRKLQALEPLTAQLARMDLSEAKRREVEGRIQTQQAETRRDLAWVDDRLRTLTP